MDTACRRGEQDARSPTSPKGQDRQRRNVHNIFILTSSSTTALKPAPVTSMASVLRVALREHIDTTLSLLHDSSSGSCAEHV